MEFYLSGNLQSVKDVFNLRSRRSRYHHRRRYLTSPLTALIAPIGGPAGCVIAGRLAKADPKLEILLIEQGDNNKDNPIITTPASFLANILPGSTTIDATIAAPSDFVAGRSLVVPSGCVLGGGSSVNFMKYTRPSASDFDDWKTEGWTFNDVLPLFKKVSFLFLIPFCEMD